VKWAEKLRDNRAIAEYVAQWSPYDICEEQIQDNYIGCYAALEWRNQATRKRQKACDALPVDTMPPLLVDGSEVLDGNHRLRSLLRKGVTHCWVYNIQEA
jgi:hypothetical protein